MALLYNAHTHRPTSPTALEVINVRYGVEEIPSEGYFSIGVHPYDIEKVSTIDEMRGIAKDPRCLAIGECGIDRRIDNFEKQAEIFALHCQLAEELKKPLIIHCVRASSEILSVAKRFDIVKIFHSFTKLKDSEDIYFSLSMRNIPHSDGIDINRILLETDDDNVTIEEVYKAFAEHRKIELQELETIIEKNFNGTK